MKNKKVLITGGSGYFGEGLVKKLLAKGYECHILDLNEPDKSLIDKIQFHKCDIRSKKDVIKCCENIDIIFHNVAQVPLAKDKKLFHSVNYDGTKNILEAAVINKCKHLVYTSSSAVFGVPNSNPVGDLTNPNPAEAYGLAKYEGEKIALSYNSDDLVVSVIRPRTIIGHGRLGIFQILFEWINLGKNIPVFDGGKNIYQFVHTDDLADAVILSAEKNLPEIYNIGTDNYVSMYETLESVIKHANTNSKIKSLKSSVIVPFMNLSSFLGLSPLGSYHALMYGKSMYFDLTKAKNVLGWSPKYSNEMMFKESYDWYVVNREEVLKSANKSHHKSAVKHGVLTIFNKLFL